MFKKRNTFRRQQQASWLESLSERNLLTVSRWVACWMAIALLIPGTHPALAMIAAMAALNAAVTRTPISTTLLLTKLTGFNPFAPILFASLISFFLSPKMPLIKSQLKKSQLKTAQNSCQE